MKYALVTGATKGIGKAIVRKLLCENYFVFINYAHDDAAAELFSRDLKNFKRNYLMIKEDLSIPDNIDNVMGKIEEITDRLDLLVLNAGATDYDRFGEITWKSWMEVMNTNLNVPFFLIQKLSGMMSLGGGIIMVSSILGEFPHATSYAYGVSKASLIFLAKELVHVLADKKIRVNVICPGFVDTDWQKNKPAERRQNIESKIALHRFARPEEIADIVWKINHNCYMNGATIYIDGGYNYI